MLKSRPVKYAPASEVNGDVVLFGPFTPEIVKTTDFTPEAGPSEPVASSARPEILKVSEVL